MFSFTYTQFIQKVSTIVDKCTHNYETFHTDPLITAVFVLLFMWKRQLLQ